jgi:PAS domain S-box-containing protein
MSVLLDLPSLVQELPGIYVVLSPDPEFRMLEVSNRRLEATMTRREDVVGRPLFDVFTDNPKGDGGGSGLSAMRQSLLRILQTHRTEVLPVLRYDLVRPDGSFEERYWIPSNTPVFDTEGQLAYILHHAEDITAAHRATNELRAADTRHRQIYDSATDFAIISFDLEGLITSWNRGALEVLGWTEQEMLGQPAARFFTPEDNAQSRPQVEMKMALEKGFATDERWHLRKDGRRFWASGETTPLKVESGQVQGFVKILRDRTVYERLNTERDIAVRKLAQLNETLKIQVAKEAADRDRIWQLSTDLMDVCDVNGRLLSVNEAWTVMLGWPEEVLLKTNFLDLVHPDDREATRAELQRLDAGESTLRFENRFRCHNGSYRIISWVAEPYEHRFYATGRDLTEQRAVEEQLRQSQKMEAIGQLTGGIAHDFNNMLATITSSLELMNRRIASGKSGDLTRYVTMASTAAQSAAALIQRLLAFSRKQSLDLQPLDVNAAIAQMQDMLRRSMGEHIQFELALQPGLPTVKSDRNQLENALLNLTINARDAMPEGGIIRITTSSRELDASYAAMHPEVMPGQYVMVSVSDNGTGMSPEVIAKAFDPFFTTKPIGQGTGLGLSMIYGFARQTGGHASIHSVVDEGTTVNVYLPCNIPTLELPVTQQQLVARSPKGRGETVLFVEDEPGVRLVLGDILEELGYATHEAIDASSALTIEQSLDHLDLLVTDVGLPGTNGRQLAEMMRERRPGLKVLFVTGYANKAESRGEFLGHGMDMLTKPFTIDALAHKVQTMLGGHDPSQRPGPETSSNPAPLLAGQIRP